MTMYHPLRPTETEVVTVPRTGKSRRDSGAAKRSGAWPAVRDAGVIVYGPIQKSLLKVDLRSTPNRTFVCRRKKLD